MSVISDNICGASKEELNIEEEVVIHVGYLAEKTKLRKQRGGISSHFTKLEKNIKEKIHERGCGLSVDIEIKAAKESLQRLALKTMELQNLALNDPAESNETLTYYNEVKQRYERLLSEIKEWKDTQKPVSDKPVIDEVKPDDSISQVAGSRTSSGSSGSSRLRAAATTAALRVRAEALTKQQNIKRELMELHLREESLQLETEIAAAEAEQQVYGHVSCASVRSEPEVLRKPASALNPLAQEWQRHDYVKPDAAQDLTDFSKGTKFDSLYHSQPPCANIGVGSKGDQVESVQEMLNMIHLPKTELMTFDGDPLNYWIFVRSFDNCIGTTCISENAKLSRLLQYCTGKALSVIECCAVMSPEQGYREARKLLHERFGNDFVISKAWIQKVTEGPQLRYGDSTSLRQYADSLKGCIVTLSAMERMNEVDNQARMSRMVEKLPPFLQSRWRKEAVCHLKRYGSYPDINQLAVFIESAADEANDPVFGSIRSDVKQKPSRTSTSKGFSNFQTSVKGNTYSFHRPNCMCCSGDHAIYLCNKYKQMIPDERLKFAIDHRLCFNCFSKNHVSYSCMKPSMCRMEGCHKKHSTLLHRAVLNRNFVDKTLRDSDTIAYRQHSRNFVDHETQTFSTRTSQYGASGAGASRIALPVVPVMVMLNDQRSLITYAFLDSGSTNSFCSAELFRQLDYKGSKTSLTLTTLTSENCQTDTSCVTLNIADTKGRNKMNLPYVFVVPKLSIPVTSLTAQSDVDKWEHLQGIHLPDLELSEVMILIGQDNPTALAPLDVRLGKPDEPYAVRTVFGWTLNGPLDYGRVSAVSSSYSVHVDQDLQSCVERFWRLDHGESQLDSTHQMSVNDKHVLDIWERSIDIVDGHYTLPIPFKFKNPDLPNNYCLAEARLESLARKLHKSKVLHERYSVGIEELIEKGYAEKVDQHRNSSEGPVCIWYLPHHAVISDRKPDKLRIVFDCSAKYMGTSLNEEVLQGPDLTNKLIGVLLRFRQGQIAKMGDVEAMYHQVKVATCHRDALRFLWWPNGDMSLPPHIYMMTVHLFGGVWSPSCANFAMQHTAQNNSQDFDPETVETVMENMYVDDCLKSVSSDSQAVHLLKQLCDLLQRGGFNITKWISNSRTVLESVPHERRAKQVKDIDLSSSVLPQERALGIVWNTETDSFGFVAKTKEKPHTRRGVISVLSSVYDPFGFVCPVTLKAKQLFQGECRLKKGWNDALEPCHEEKWIDWLQKLSNIEELSIPRCVFPTNFGEVARCELHHFSDASIIGYGAVSYLRIVDTNDQIRCCFMMAKSRLAPIKQVTIPRLELSAAVVSVKLDQILRNELRLKFDASFFWTDSMIVLHQIRNDCLRFQTFVANRISIIREATSQDNWRHVESNQNPADYASRGLDADNIIETKQWIEGPEFLSKDKLEWPTVPELLEIPESELEVRKGHNFLVASSEEDASQGTTDRLMESFSSWTKLKRSVCWILRLKHCLLMRSKCPVELKRQQRMSVQPLSVNELRAAETEIVRYIQKHHYSQELQSLKSGLSVRKSSSIFLLEPMMNSNGLVCVGGRLKHAPIKNEAKHQLILPKNNHVAKLIADHTHRILGHSGSEHVLSYLRQRFWIIGARVMLKKLLKGCVHCCRFRGIPNIQRMADLPQDRVTPGEPPFTYVDVDCFGPFEVKRGRGVVKRYGCLFTCLTTRAVHLEKLDSMNTDSFINALRRFECRRGKPKRIRSDNGSNFRGAQRELKEAIQAWNLLKIQNHLAQKDISVGI